MNYSPELDCPCGSGKSFKSCCEALILRTKLPSTAEDLMRSRYAAYFLKDIAYILATHDPATLQDNYKDIEVWVNSIQWTGLEILTSEKGGVSDTIGTVHFKAFYSQEGKVECLQENSSFRKIEDQWMYVSGIHNAPIATSKNRIGRNDPCLCGSGKKYKKCCANGV